MQKAASGKLEIYGSSGKLLAKFDFLLIWAQEDEIADAPLPEGQEGNSLFKEGTAQLPGGLIGFLNVRNVNGNVIHGTGLQSGLSGLIGLDAQILHLQKAHLFVIGFVSGAVNVLKAQGFIERNGFFDIVCRNANVLDAGHPIGK